MSDELLPILVCALIGWLFLTQFIAAARCRRQLRILRHGQAGEGKVVAIQHSSVLDSNTRLYFDYCPAGTEAPIRACHVAVQPEISRAALPQTGSVVNVRYIPNRPTQAVIARLLASSEADEVRWR